MYKPFNKMGFSAALSLATILFLSILLNWERDCSEILQEHANSIHESESSESSLIPLFYTKPHSLKQSISLSFFSSLQIFPLKSNTHFISADCEISCRNPILLSPRLTSLPPPFLAN